jgi:hypothetical protein
MFISACLPGGGDGALNKSTDDDCRSVTHHTVRTMPRSLAREDAMQFILAV